MRSKQFTTGETVLHAGSYQCIKSHIIKSYSKGEIFSTCPKDSSNTNWLLIE